MTKELTPIPDITYVSGRLSLRLLDVKVMDPGAADLAAHLGEAIRQSVGEFFGGHVDVSESADVVDITLDEVHETYLDETGEQLVNETERKVDYRRWMTPVA